MKQLDLDRERARTTVDSQTTDAIAPGRRSASAELKSSDVPVASGLLMRKARDGNGVAANADAAVATAASSSGNALPDTLKSRFESSLGTDLSSVRVHTGAESAAAAGAVGAKAYTLGNDIHFGAGHFDPTSAGGQHLIAHEVAHTVQQRGGSPRRQNKLEVSAPGDAFEHAADAAADAMVSGRRASVDGASRTIARDLDQDMVDAGAAGADYHGADAKVQVIDGHTVSGDESEARKILGDIAATEKLVAAHSTAQIDNRTATNKIAPLQGYLVENRQASAVVEHYLATVSSSGDYQSQFAASYHNSKADYGQVMGMYQAYVAAGGTLKNGAQTNALAAAAKNPAFVDARGRYEGVRAELTNDHDKIGQVMLHSEAAKSEYQKLLHDAKSAAASVVAKKKTAELATVRATIDSTASTMMTVGSMLASAVSGVMALGAGKDISTMLESNPEIAAPNAPAPPPAVVDPGKGPPTITVPSPLAAPNPSAFAAPFVAPDTRHFEMPKQAVAKVKGLAEQGVTLAGGPQAILTQALLLLEKSKIDKLQSEIDAANEEANLAQVASAAQGLLAKQKAYEAQIKTLIDDVTNLMNHKSQMDTYTQQMITALKQSNANKDLQGAIRLLGAGDKFLAQIDLTIGLGKKQQSTGHDARSQRYDINEGNADSNKTNMQGPGQLHYWSVAKDKGVNDFLAAKHMVELKARGKDSLESSHGENSTQFDVGKSITELEQWKTQMQQIRDAAQGTLGIGVTSGHS